MSACAIELHFETHSAEQTIAAGRSIAQAISGGLVLVLRGDLGAGKTTLVKGIAEALGAADPEEVTSPTFTLVHEYHGAVIQLFHLDLYRLVHERELLPLGLDEMMDADAVMLIEWGEKFPSLATRANGEIALEHAGGDSRRITARWQP